MEAYSNGDMDSVWDTMKEYVFGNNKFYSGLTSRRVAEYLLFTAETPKEIEEAYRNTYESINENHRANFYTEEDLLAIKDRIPSSDREGLYAMDSIIEIMHGQEEEMELS